MDASDVCSPRLSPEEERDLMKHRNGERRPGGTDSVEGATNCTTFTKDKDKTNGNNELAAAPLKLSVTFITSTTAPAPVSDHFIALAGDAASAANQESHQKCSQTTVGNTNTSPAESDPKNRDDRRGASSTILRGHDTPSAWGTEDLLQSCRTRSTDGSSERKRCKAKVDLSGLFGGKPGVPDVGEGSQHCPYTTMGDGTRVDFPRTKRDTGYGIGRGDGVGPSTQYTHPATAGEYGSSGLSCGHAPPFGTSLVGRLGSALRSLTGGATADSQQAAEARGILREGQPGPFGMKYTQQVRGYSPFEPSLHQQLRKKLTLNPALTAAAVLADGTTGKRGDGESTVSSTRAPSVDVDKPRRTGDSRSASLPKSEAIGIAGAEHHVTQAEPSRARPDTVGSRGDAESKKKNNMASDGEADAEAGGGLSSTRNVVKNDKGESSYLEGSLQSESGGGKERSSGMQSQMKTAGLWELKAERSRVEQTLAETEAERDWDKMRAAEAENQLARAVLRLETLRKVSRTGILVEA